MRPILLACTLALTSTAPAQQPQTADAIMAQVASNQDAAQADRAHYVYIQHARIASRRGKTVLCEELTDSRITPSDAGSHQQLLKLNGRLRKDKTYITYAGLAPAKDGGSDGPMDRDLVENMRNNLTNGDSKDGISPNLFPLTSKEQSGYTFHLLGRAPMNGRDCYHIDFSPKDPNDFNWKGDAYIDATAFQPVIIRTTMSRKLPLAVRMLLGTNVPGLGFTIVYAPQPDGVWFPTTFGTEFKIHVLFFLNRQITFSAENRDFEKTHVSSRIIPSSSDEESLPQKQP